MPTINDVTMSRQDVRAMIEIEPVLQRLGLSLFCLRCFNAGRPDGVRCANGDEDTVWTIDCGCCSRRYVRSKA
jgi:hypothetical protein